MRGIKITGLQGVRHAIDALPKELQRAAEAGALRAGGKVILPKAKALAMAAADSGLLAKSLGITVRKTRAKVLTARVGARTGFARVFIRNGETQPKKHDPSKYAHLVELGTSRSAARPYLRPAIESSGNGILDAMAKGYEKGIHTAIARIAKRSTT